MARVYGRTSAMPTNQSTADTPTGSFSLGGGVGASAMGSSASISAHLTLTALVGLGLLAVVIFLPRVI